MKWFLLPLTAFVVGFLNAACAPDKGDSGPPGLEGPPGPAGPPADDEIETILLCPSDTRGPFREYLVRVGGGLFGAYAHGGKVELTKLGPGEWATTDGRDCRFVITVDLEVEQ
jgi:hypothetical protein